MAFKTKSDLINWIILFAIVILLIELTFFDGGLLFSLVISGAFIYYGKKKWHRKLGKLVLLIGVISAVVTIINMFAFKLFLLTLLGVLVYRFFQSKKHPTIFTPDFEVANKSYEAENIQSKQLLFKNSIMGSQKTPNHVYEWEDINIQMGVGESIVDLSNTLLPKGESIISIRNIVGSIQILVPYDLEVEVVHSVIVGSVTIFQNREQRFINKNVHFHTAQYGEVDQKLKIVTSSIVGNLEVKRI